MIYCTGDTHGDVLRFKDKKLKKLKKGDSLIICGDFGFIWDGSKKEQRLLKKLGRKKYNILFVEGSHENFELLNSYPVSEWNGGLTRQISGRLRQLCRGSIFELDGVKLFSFGGGSCLESELADGSEQYREDALPTNAEIQTAIDNLEQNGRLVDYVVSYEPPSVLKDFVHEDNSDVLVKSQINALFDEIVQHCTYKKWVFGKCHKNKIVSPKYTAVYTGIIKLDTPKPPKRRLFKKKSAQYTGLSKTVI